MAIYNFMKNVRNKTNKLFTRKPKSKSKSKPKSKSKSTQSDLDAGSEDSLSSIIISSGGNSETPYMISDSLNTEDINLVSFSSPKKMKRSSKKSKKSKKSSKKSKK